MRERGPSAARASRRDPGREVRLFLLAECKRTTSAQSLIPPQVAPKSQETPRPPAAFVPEPIEEIDEAPRTLPQVEPIASTPRRPMERSRSCRSTRSRRSTRSEEAPMGAPEVAKTDSSKRPVRSRRPHAPHRRVRVRSARTLGRPHRRARAAAPPRALLARGRAPVRDAGALATHARIAARNRDRTRSRRTSRAGGGLRGGVGCDGLDTRCAEQTGRRHRDRGVVVGRPRRDGGGARRSPCDA